MTCRNIAGDIKKVKVEAPDFEGRRDSCFFLNWLSPSKNVSIGMLYWRHRKLDMPT